MHSIRDALAALVTGVAAALVVVALAILPYLSPAWVAFAQDRAQAQAWTGFTTQQLRAVTGEILADLVIGPTDFDVTLDGTPVLKATERSHMRDVRGVFLGFFVLAAAGAVAVVALFLGARGAQARRRFWGRLEGTGKAIVAVTIVGGAAGVVLFDGAFTLFHEIFFPGGNWMFDPRTDRLVQLFPESFWVESTIAVGVTVIGLAVVLIVVARWRGHSLASRARLAASLEARAVVVR